MRIVVYSWKYEFFGFYKFIAVTLYVVNMEMNRTELQLNNDNNVSTYEYVSKNIRKYAVVYIFHM